MKKIILTLLIATLAFSLVACGPDYTEEFNAAVEAYNQKVDEYDEAVEDFEDELDDTESLEDVVALCDNMLKTDEEILADTKAYLEEIEGYEEGIKDVEAYEKAVESMKDTIEVLEEDIENMPAVKEFFSLSMESINLAIEWQTVLAEKSGNMATMLTYSELNPAIDELVAINNDYILQLSDISTKLDEIGLSEYSDEIEEGINAIDELIIVIEDMNDELISLKQ